MSSLRNIQHNNISTYVQVINRILGMKHNNNNDASAWIMNKLLLLHFFQPEEQWLAFFSNPI